MDTYLPFRNGAGAERPSFDVSDELQEVAQRLEIYALRRGVQIEVDAPPYAMVTAERSRMRQVFWHLMTLAVDATSPGGNVIVTAYQDDQGVDVEFAEGDAAILSSSDVSARVSSAAGQRLDDVRRMLAAEDVHLQIRECADGTRAYILQLRHPDAPDSESRRAA
ncbi:MAG: sensor histidine kinase [Planctomycetaceae bacterium]|nr:MAG: sensor histidine kinase [Planctomycetaceae bacterium]